MLSSLLLLAVITWPPGAQIIERASVPSPHGHRELVLWMTNPTRHEGGESYCGTPVHGDYYEGAPHLSLIDPAAQRLINTIDLPASLQIPFKVSNQYWHVENAAPKILHLRDLTGEGTPAQFPLFQYSACGLVETSAAGYSAKLDRARLYPIQTRTRLSTTAAQLFAVKPIRPGHWDFTWGPGHGVDDRIHERVHFDAARQLFLSNPEFVPNPNLPKDARIIEIAQIDGAPHPRQLLLWMNNPTYFKPPRDDYGAIDILYGGRWSGPAHVSLIDPTTSRVINTIDLPKDIPIPEVAHRYGYHPLTTEEEGPVQVLYLQDLTGEGVKGQFHFLEYLNSSTNETRAYGYSPSRDVVVPYPIVTKGKQSWSFPVIFQQPQARPGLWHFIHQGDHGDDSTYDEHVTFDTASQRFLRTVRIPRR